VPARPALAVSTLLSRGFPSSSFTQPPLSGRVSPSLPYLPVRSLLRQAVLTVLELMYLRSSSAHPKRSFRLRQQWTQNFTPPAPSSRPTCRKLLQPRSSRLPSRLYSERGTTGTGTLPIQNEGAPFEPSFDQERNSIIRYWQLPRSPASKRRS
jgi:hypothetical protein